MLFANDVLLVHHNKTMLNRSEMNTFIVDVLYRVKLRSIQNR